jgi:hypothetical protein
MVLKALSLQGLRLEHFGVERERPRAVAYFYRGPEIAYFMLFPPWRQ